jgi:hypothetical protein
LTSVVVGLHAYWFWYWGKGWGYRSLTPQWIERDVQRDLQEYARVLGEMAVLTMSFLTFPMARNSVWYVDIYMYMYICTYICIYLHVYICTYFRNMFTCIYIYIHVYRHIYSYLRIQGCGLQGPIRPGY